MYKIDLSIIIPSLNESENLKLLIPLIKKNINKKFKYEVIIIDNMSSNIVESISGCQHLNYDLNDYDTLKEVKIPKVNTLLHLAGQASGPTSFQIPEIDIKNNILATLNLIKWCKINNIKRVIFASSSMVYGDNPDNECLNEDNICYPKTIYASSKYYAENLFKICY